MSNYKKTDIDREYEKAIREQQKSVAEARLKKLRSMKQKFLEKPSPELAKQIDDFETKNFKGGAGKVGAKEQAIGQLVQSAGGGNPIADGLAAGISTGNPLVGVGLGVISGLQGAAAEKQRKRDIDSNALMQQSRNEQNTQLRRSSAIQSLANNLSRSLLGQVK